MVDGVMKNEQRALKRIAKSTRSSSSSSSSSD